jgi:Flp pilus assembly protein TadD
MSETSQQVLDRGALLHRQGNLREAESIYRQVLAAEPNNSDALNLLGVLAMQAGKLEASVELIQRAISVRPVSHYYRNLGLVLSAMSRFAEAAAAQRKCLEMDPMSLAANVALGQALLDMDQSQQAVMAYQRCLSLKPGEPASLLGLGCALYQTGELEESVTRLEQAIQIDPNLPAAHTNLGLVLLTLGNFERGWPEFEWRWKTPKMAARQQALGKPLWDGSELSGRTILIHGEIGGGDTLNFSRYVPLVAQRGGRVVFTCQPPLLQLLKQLQGVDRFLEPGEPLPEFDVHCSLISLPAVFKTTLATIPAQSPLLVADPVKSQRWKERMPQDARLKVGIAWAGNVYPPSRSMQLSMLEPLAGIPNLWFCSLQKGEGARQLAAGGSSLSINDWTNELTDFTDTAALIANLDMVLSVDTSVAHLAGAMGKPTWVMLKTVPDFRWMMERADSPWYPTMRLFRQKQAGDWGGVVRAVAEALESSKGLVRAR